MEAKQNSLFFNASDIFNLKPQTSRNTYKYNPLTKSTDNPHSSPINEDNRNTISPSLVYKHRRDITPKINAKRKLQLNKSKDNNYLNDDDIVIDTAKYARDQRKKYIDKIHNDAVLLGTDSNNYITTNEMYQQHAKRQLKKSKTLGLLNNNNKVVNTTQSSKGKKYLPFTSRNTNGFAKAKPGNTDYENKFYNNISNIFNDPHKDKINKTLTPTKPSSHNKPEYPSSTKHQRSKNYAQNIEAALPVLNFQDQNIQLLRRRMPQQEHNVNTNAKRVRTTITHTKSVDNVNTHSNRSGIKVKKQQVIRMQEQYEIIADSNIDIKNIKRIYRNNGLHIFNDKVHYNVHDTDSKSHYVFNISINNDNNDYKSRIDKTLTDINKTNKGIIIRKLPSTSANTNTKAKRNECRKWLECELKIRKEDKEGILKSYNYKPKQQQHPPK
jgi:hypothetical protein